LDSHGSSWQFFAAVLLSAEIRATEPSEGNVMQDLRSLSVYVCGILSFTAALAHAEVKITQDTLGPAGQIFGGSISPKGEHVAVFAAKGSHYQIIVDGVEGPRIDNLIFHVASDTDLNTILAAAPMAKAN
jgi:hypothetical protein